MSTLPRNGYLTVGVETQIAWPDKERTLVFRGRKCLLLPGSPTLARMVRVQTDATFGQDEAHRLVLELLSALAWAQQSSAETTIECWATCPINIGNRRSMTIGRGHFDYLPDPVDPKARLALALYREGESVNLTPYKVLGFFKIINIIRDKGPAQIQWIKDNLQHITDRRVLARVAAIQAMEPDVAKYLYVSARCAVAHAFDQTNVVNPDDPRDLIRMSEDLPVIRDLARIAIERELNVMSESQFHQEHLYELAGIRTVFGDALVARVKAGEEVPPTECPLPKALSLRVRDVEPTQIFESMGAAVEWVKDGCVCVRLASSCQRMLVFVGFDFVGEHLVCEPLTDVQFTDDGSIASAKVVLQWAQLHRPWAGGNGVIELWDATGARIARSQPYLPPVNSWFDHAQFDKLESELRARIEGKSPPAQLGAKEE